MTKVWIGNVGMALAGFLGRTMATPDPLHRFWPRGFGWLMIGWAWSCGVLAAETPIPLAAYAQLPSIDMPVLSPSGERYAFVATLNGKRHVFVRTVDGKPLAMAPVDDIKLRKLSWAGDAYVVVALSDTVSFGSMLGFKYELQQLVSINLQSGQAVSLLRNQRVMNAAYGQYGYVQREGRWYAYLGALPLKRSMMSRQTYIERYNPNLVEVDLETGALRTISHGRKHGDGWVLDAQGAVMAYGEYDEARTQWRLLRGDDRQVLARVDDPLGLSGLLGQGRRPGTVLYGAVDEAGARRYLEVDLSGQTAPVDLPLAGEVRKVLFDPGQQLLIGLQFDGDHPQWRLFDAAHQARVAAARKAFPQLDVEFFGASQDFQRLIVKTVGVGDSGSWWLVDIASGKAELLGEAYPALQGARVGGVRMVDYRAADGLHLRGVLTLPPGRAPKHLPVVALPHGGPAARDYPQFDWIAQAFASRGYAVWQPNFRGSAGYGIALRNAGNGEWGRKMQTDISDGLAELARQGIVDPRRACIVGASYGGYAALAGVTLQQGVYRCAVSIAGVSDLDLFIAQTRQYNGFAALRYWMRFFGVASHFDDSIEARSPASLAKRADAPVLLIHGKDDVVVTFDHSRVMHKALQRAGKSVELVVLDSEDHWLSRATTRLQMLESAVTFVQRHLPAGEAED